jgi:hypothetical protein
VKWSRGPGVTVTAASLPLSARVAVPVKSFDSFASVVHVFDPVDVGAVAVMSTLTKPFGASSLPGELLSCTTLPPTTSLVQPDSVGTAAEIDEKPPVIAIFADPSGSLALDVFVIVTVNVSVSPTITLVGETEAV